MKLSRSGYYKWLSRKGTLNQYDQNRKTLKKMIIDIHQKHTIWGYRNIADYIRKETGWQISNLLCHQCCKALGIKSKARKHYNPPGTEHEIYPNILNKQFSASRPFEKVCTDTTSFKHQNHTYDWNIYVDLFNHEIVAYDLRLSKSGHGVANHYQALRNFQKAKEKRGYKDLETILHSDQGAIYTSQAFNAQLDSTIKRSMSRKGTPTDNPVLESLNGWIKDELRLDFNLKQTNDVYRCIHDYVKYYNHIRRAWSLHYKSPVQYRTELSFN